MYDDSNFSIKQIAKVIQNLSDFCNRKIMLQGDKATEEIKDLANKINLFHAYLIEWEHRLSYSSYYARRKEKYTGEILNLQHEMRIFLQNSTKERKQKIIALLKQVETKELSQIYDGSILTFDKLQSAR